MVYFVLKTVVIIELRTLHGVRSGDTMATYQIPAPEPFDFSNTDDWPKWIRRFERKTEENQISTLIYSMRDTADDIYQSFRLTDEGCQ